MFLPKFNINKNRYERSSFCIDGLTENKCWGLLNTHCSKHSESLIPARVDLTVEFVKSINLNIDPNWVPDKHVDIINWPELEDERKDIAQTMSRELSISLSPT